MFGGRVSEAQARNREAKCVWAGSIWIGLILVGSRGWEADPCPGQPSSLAGGDSGRLELQLRGRDSVHGVINLLTQGSAGTLWCVTRCLAF